jgi:hypothetical protein
VGTGQALVAGQVCGDRQATQISRLYDEDARGIHIPPSAATVAEYHDRTDRGRSERCNERRGASPA